MILCVAANAAVDKTVVIENFTIDKIHRPSLELVLPGGKSCNVARVSRVLGQPALVTGWVGGHAGRWIEEALQAEGIQTAFVRTSVESRTCLSVVDPVNKTLTEIYENGRVVTPEALAELYRVFGELAQTADWVALSGSLPPGAPPDFNAVLARMAGAAGAKAVIDAGGEALRRGLEEGRPYMVKCNRSELAGLAGEPLDRLEDILRVACALEERWGARMVITLGAAGAVACVEGQTWLAQAPQIEAVSAVGSGDAFLAGLVHAVQRGQTFGEALRLAIACGSANALQLGAGRVNQEDIDRLLPLVVVKEANTAQPH